MADEEAQDLVPAIVLNPRQHIAVTEIVERERLCSEALAKLESAKVPKEGPADEAEEGWGARSDEPSALLEECHHLYRPRLVGHRAGACAAGAAGESRSRLTAAGGLGPCRPTGRVAP